MTRISHPELKCRMNKALVTCVVVCWIFSANLVNSQDKDDFLLKSVEIGLQHIGDKFGFEDKLERALLLEALRGKLEDVSIISVVLCRPAPNQVTGSHKEMMLETKLILQWSVLKTADVSSPFAVVTLVRTRGDVRSVVQRTIRYVDGNWKEVALR
jgi:hypothetical protein